MQTSTTQKNRVPFAYVTGIVTAARCYRLIEMTKMDREVTKAQYEWEYSRSPFVFPEDVPSLVADAMDDFDARLEKHVAEAEDTVNFAVSAVLPDCPDEGRRLVSGAAKRIAAIMSSCKIVDVLSLEDTYNPSSSHIVAEMPSTVIRIAKEIDETASFLLKIRNASLAKDDHDNPYEPTL